MTLPSALTLTMALEVVGEIDALKPIAIPRPRNFVPLPLSKGRSQPSRRAVSSSTVSNSPSFTIVPTACGRPLRNILRLRKSTGSMPSSRAMMSVWLS